jgi:hypothetical protein
VPFCASVTVDKSTPRRIFSRFPHPCALFSFQSAARLNRLPLSSSGKPSINDKKQKVNKNFLILDSQFYLFCLYIFIEMYKRLFISDEKALKH